MGATADGDLQVGWLRASAADPVERPVFLASRLHDKEGNCALRVGDAVVSRPFHASPTLYVNADFVLQSLFLDASLAKRFQRLEELRTPLNPDPPIQGEYESRDVAPLAGRLVMYDSVAVPHGSSSWQSRATRAVFRALAFSLSVEGQPPSSTDTQVERCAFASRLVRVATRGEGPHGRARTASRSRGGSARSPRQTRRRRRRGAVGGVPPRAPASRSPQRAFDDAIATA